MKRTENTEKAAALLNKYMGEYGVGQAELASMLNISVGAVSHIVRQRMVVSAELAATCERELGIHAELLRPDVFHGLSAKPGL